MQGPTDLPWNPIELLPPGTSNPGLIGTQVAWEFLWSFLTRELPAGFDEIVNALDL